MNPFESFMNKRNQQEPQPDKLISTEPQPETSLEKNQSLVEVAKQKVEGVLLYAPISDEIKQELLTALEALTLEEYDAEWSRLSTAKYEQGDEQQAANWIKHKMEPELLKIKSQLNQSDFEMLEFVIHKYSYDKSSREYTEERTREWLNQNITK